jgi:predicted AAA+ superfamily ATPase
MYKRFILNELVGSAMKYPVVAVLGPRQSGKTTLIQMAFPHLPYVLLEDLDKRDFARSDPKGFLQNYRSADGLIIDEAQYVPELFSYIQGIVDREKKPGMFILSGSQNFLLNDRITQSLSGRVRMLTLLPPSIQEIKDSVGLPDSYEKLIWSGCYPRIQFEKFEPLRWMQDYILTYLERDVRLIKGVTDLYQFQKFMALCAARVGQLLNWSELARDCGVNVQTIHSWISVLEASYIVFLQYPYHENFGKRLVKSPKLYFYDTGIACSLLRIKSASDLFESRERGGLFESMVISDIRKRYYHSGLIPDLYFWRDKQGLEVDCLINEGRRSIPIEIKSGHAVSSEWLVAMKKWCDLAEKNLADGILVYGGNESQKRSLGRIISWRDLDQIFPIAEN